MALPGSTINILDGGLGVTTPASSRPHIMGVFESGPLNTPTVISNQRQLKDTFGIHGPGNDLVGYILDQAGGPTVVTRVSPSVAGAYLLTNVPSTVSPVVGATGNSISFLVATTVPKNSFQIVINVITGGLRTATTFQYSLDGGFSFSPTIAAAATVPLGTSGVTAEFADGTTGPYQVGASYINSSTAPHYASADLTTAYAGVDVSVLVWDFFVFAGEAATASAAGTLFSAISTKLNAYKTGLDRYYRAIMGAGEGVASLALTTFNALTSERIAVMYGKFRTAPSVAVIGRGLPLMPALNAAAMRATANVMSTDLAQTAGSDKVGPLAGASAITADEYRNNQGLDDKKIGTLRTAANDSGVFITNVWLKSADGSDFQYWQHGRIMDEACKTVSQQHWQLTSSSVVTKSDGTGSIAEFSAQAVEKKVQRALDNRIGSALRGIGPTAVDGTTGHVSDQKYQVDRTNNVLSTNTLIATVAIVPRGYLKQLVATISFKLSI